jgi:molybdopterin converting factor small subunit
MRVRVKLFATFRQYLPSGSQEGAYDLEVPAGTHARQLLLELGVPAAKSDVIVIMVNGRHCPEDQALEEGDVLSAFPPIAGG